MQTRRTFVKLLSLAASSMAVPAIGEPNAHDTAMDYMDGYHGGIIGHMPYGSWRDIMNALKEYPDWKLNLDIEPESWAAPFCCRDPESFSELHAHLKRGERVEMVAGTYAQPYGWAISGESNIRQLQIGQAVIRESFPENIITTYAVQEPCWASCLPQILKQLGFTAASLKNANTAWGGYSAGFDADVVHWIGPDGSSIDTVPRYAMERVQKVYETESVDATPEFAERCRAAGIENPAGMCFQDLGWASKPRLNRPGITYRMWKEYFAKVGQPKKDWHFSLEDILVTLPWGDALLRNVAQEVRSAENRLVTAEKLASLAACRFHQLYPQQELEAAWKHLLLTQAHDAWITAQARSGRDAWSFTTAQNTYDAEKEANRIIDTVTDAAALLNHPPAPEKQLTAQSIVILNSLATPRNELVEISISSDPHTSGFRLTDASGKQLTTQILTDRHYNSRAVLAGKKEGPPQSDKNIDAGINHATVLARVSVPALGLQTYTIEPLYNTEPPTPTGATAKLSDNGDCLIETSNYRIRLDARHGGTIASLISLPDNTEFIDPNEIRRFGEYRGYFITQKQWLSSADNEARITILEPGPLRIKLRIDTTAGPTRLSTQLTIIDGDPRLDYEVSMRFNEPTWIGDPWEVPAANRRSEPRRSQNDGRWKLQVHHPFGKSGELYKSAAFDVCKSRNADTSFQGWNEIKHNIIAQWVDLFQPNRDHGLAIMADGTTAYNYGPDQPLGLVLAWAWDGSFWWGKRPIEGTHKTRYAVLPHKGRWDEAGLWHQYSRFCEPLLSAISAGSASAPAAHFSLVDTNDPGLQLSTSEHRDGNLHLRLFNAESSSTKHTIRLGVAPKSVELVDLHGKSLGPLKLHASANSQSTFTIDLPRFGLANIQCRLL